MDHRRDMTGQQNRRSNAISQVAVMDWRWMLLSWWRALVVPIQAQRCRWALWVPLPLATGCWLWVSSNDSPHWWLGPACLAGAMVLWRVLAARDWWRMPFFVFALVALGFSAASWRGYYLTAPMIDKVIRHAPVEGRILASEPWKKGQRLIVDQLVIGGLAPEQTPHRIRVVMRHVKVMPKPGDRLRVAMRLFPLPRPNMPGGFDYGRQLWFDDLQATGFTFGAGEILPIPDWQGPAIAIARMRQAISLSIQQGLHGRFEDEETGNRLTGLAVALLTGQRGLLSTEDVDAMRDAGLAHLLAISGLHLGLVTGMVFFVVRAGLALIPWLVLRVPVKKWAALTAWMAAAFYWQLAGATIPTERAFIMASVFLAAIMLDRQALSLRVVAIAAVLVLVLRPESILYAGFHLSFAATTALVAAAEFWQRYRQRLRQQGRLALPDAGRLSWLFVWPIRYLLMTLATSLIAGLATAPLAAWHFGHMAHYGLVANLVAVPIAALWVMPMGILALVLLPFDLHAGPLMAMGVGLDQLLSVAHRVAALPGAVGQVAKMPDVAILLWILASLWMVIWWGRVRLLAVPLLILVMVFMLRYQPQHPAIVISESGKQLLIDGQPPSYWAQGQKNEWILGQWGKYWGLDGDEFVALQHSGSDVSSPQYDYPGTNAVQSWHCDAYGCSGIIGRHITPNGWRFALSTHAGSLALDCQKANILISLVPIRRSCPGPILVIDRFDLWRHGAHAIHFDPGPRLLRADTRRHRRPWSSSPTPKSRTEWD